jgi:hypothetical protein
MKWTRWLWVCGAFGLVVAETVAGCSAGSGGDEEGAGAGKAAATSVGAGQGGDTGCATDTFPGELVPLDLLVVLDRSDSMVDDGKWGAVISALQAFVADPSSDGVGLGLQYFPTQPSGPIPDCPNCGYYGPCIPGANVCGGSFSPNDSCDPADYTSPDIPIATLPGVRATFESSLASTEPEGASTPSQPAMEGAVQYATEWAAANPAHITLIVYASDGEPTNCTPNSISGVAAAAGAALAAAPSVKTFVVGVGSELSSLQQIASAGGTGQAYLVDTGGNVTDQFIEALHQIRETGQCQFQIPLPSDGIPDFGRVNVTLVDPDDPSANTQLANVGSAEACGADGGWYYDNAADPRVIVLCPASCDRVKQEDLDVSVVLGCQTIVP